MSQLKQIDQHQHEVWKSKCRPAQDHCRKTYLNMMRSRRMVMMGVLIDNDKSQNENTEIAKNTFKKID